MGLLTGVLLLLASEAAADPGFTPAMQVAVAIASDDDRIAGLSGHIVEKIDDERFVLADGTGEIEVEIDADLPRGGYTLEPGMPVEIWGEVETRFFRPPMIQARSVNVLLPGLPTIIYEDEVENDANGKPAPR